MATILIHMQNKKMEQIHFLMQHSQDSSTRKQSEQLAAILFKPINFFGQVYLKYLKYI